MGCCNNARFVTVTLSLLAAVYYRDLFNGPASSLCG
jgi:hypothetical protein